MQKFFHEHGDYFYFVFRVLIGLLFFLHGVQKVFSPQPFPAFSLFWFAMIIELIVGVAIIVGGFTRIVALIGAIEMVVAYAYMHLPKGWNPLSNQGELAVLFFAAFLVLMTYGSKKWGITEDW